MLILVEDNVIKFPYQLLTPVLGDNLIGSKGKDNLPYLIRNIDDAVVLVDVTADNASTIVSYDRALESASTRRNVHVVPIPCIEYYFIYGLLGYVNADTSAVLKFDDYRKYTHNVDGKALITTRKYEKFCKSVIKNYSNCMVNGVYVSQDCMCKRKPYNMDCVEIPVSSKQMRLFYSLPVLLVNTFDKEKCDSIIRNAIHVGEHLYYKMATSFKIAGIISTITELPYNSSK